MQKELTNILKGKLLTLPFADLVAGLAQTLTYTDTNEDGATVTKRLPVSYDVWNGGDCTGKEIALIPDSSRKSIIYFEDYGIAPAGVLHGLQGYIASLRLVCWLDRSKLVGDAYTEIAGRCQASIIGVLCNTNPKNSGMFQRLSLKLQRIPPQDPALFARYTYNETDRQYLRPPFEFFGIDLTAAFYVSAKCLEGINWNVEACV